MRLALTLLIALLAVGATAQEPNTLGLFFSDTEFTPENTNWESTTGPVNMYLVLLNGTVGSVGGYETGIDFDETSGLIVTSATGVNGWTNFGDGMNHLVGYQTPIPNDPAGVVLCTLEMLHMGSGFVCINLVPAEPASIPGSPAISDGDNPDVLLACSIYNAPDCTATINGAVAAEPQSFSHIKGLFR